jgi:hypothetical protein
VHGDIQLIDNQLKLEPAGEIQHFLIIATLISMYQVTDN